MKPRDTLDLRADLLTKVKGSTYQRAMEEHLLLDIGVLPTEARKEAVDYARVSIASAQYSLEQGENFFVSADMCDLVEFSARMLDSTDLMDSKLMPSTLGFCVFEKPIEITDVRGATLKINCIAWCMVVNRSGADAIVHLWNDEYLTPDDAALEMNADPAQRAMRMEIIGRWGYIGLSRYEDGEPLGDTETPLSEVHAYKYESEGIEPQPVTNILRIVHALWLMLGQTIVRTDKELGDRRQARAMKWMKLPNDVTVIQLRRTESKPAEGESVVEWKHRWITRGHWRWQPYKDEAGEWVRKRIWIHAFVKGPADKPLIVTKKVNALVR